MTYRLEVWHRGVRQHTLCKWPSDDGLFWALPFDGVGVARFTRADAVLRALREQLGFAEGWVVRVVEDAL